MIDTAPILAAAPLIIMASVGCRGRAQRDLYEAKMAHEIRVLEDQLYEADYHNRVLIDKLEQIRLKSEAASKFRSPDTTPSYGSPSTSVPSEPRNRKETSVPEPIRDPIPDSPIPADLPEIGPADLPEIDSASPSKQPSTSPDLDAMDDIGAMIDVGQPVDPAQITDRSKEGALADDVPKPDNVPKREDTPEPSTEPSLKPDETEKGIQLPSQGVPIDDSGELLPAPGGPEPPSLRDTEVPSVLPGEILPPSILDGEEEKPPGQILLPDSAQNGADLPAQLRIHPSLSGGNRIDGKIENMMLVVNVLDKLGRTLNLNEYNVDATLSIVIFDADQEESDEARLGRWDFNAPQVLALIKSDPISGLHVPISWQGRQPAGKEVVVHVRLRAEEDEMRCEGRIKVQRANAVAEWTPRGEILLR